MYKHQTVLIENNQNDVTNTPMHDFNMKKNLKVENVPLTHLSSQYNCLHAVNSMY